MSTIRLRPGMHYAPIEGGVYFTSARASFVVKGPAALFRLVDICIPLLEDGTEVDALVAAVGVAAARPLILRLLDAFDTRGSLLHPDRLMVPEPAASERERFPETLSYLEAHCQDPYALFRRVRACRVLVSGPAEALGPALRGLVRSGFGEVVAHTPEPERLAALASRHPHLRLLLSNGDETLPVAGRPPQVAVIFAEDTVPGEVIGHLPLSCIVVPVRLGKDVAIVGPALAPADPLTPEDVPAAASGGFRAAARAGSATASPADGRAPVLAAVEALWARATQWCRADGGELLVRPSGDLLAGALAGHLALNALIGREPGRVYLVHGPDLVSDTITPDLAPPGAEVPAAAEAPARDSGPLGPPAEAPGTTVFGPAHQHQATPAPAGEWLATVAAPWTGLLRVTVPGTLPQLPLALTMAEGRSCHFEGRVVGFGPDQETSTTEAALEALRRHGDAELRRVGPGAGHEAVAAAGADETRALLDGMLRLLAADAGWQRRPSSELAWLGVDDVDGRRLWRALEEYEATPVRLTDSEVGEVGWHLVTVRHRDRGCRLGSGWGPTLAVAARAALSGATATVQVRRSVEAGFSAAEMVSGYVAHLHDPYLEELAAAVSAWLDRSAHRLRGRRLVRDPVTGPIDPWCGSVWLEERPGHE
jgi:hypothetical protein